LDVDGRTHIGRVTMMTYLHKGRSMSLVATTVLLAIDPDEQLAQSVTDEKIYDKSDLKVNSNVTF
jgi:hypothetical protein